MSVGGEKHEKVQYSWKSRTGPMSCESDCIISVQILPLFVFTNCYLSRTGSFLVPEALLGLPVPIVHFLIDLKCDLKIISISLFRSFYIH